MATAGKRPIMGDSLLHVHRQSCIRSACVAGAAAARAARSVSHATPSCASISNRLPIFSAGRIGFEQMPW